MSVYVSMNLASIGGVVKPTTGSRSAKKGQGISCKKCGKRGNLKCANEMCRSCCLEKQKGGKVGNKCRVHSVDSNKSTNIDKGGSKIKKGRTEKHMRQLTSNVQDIKLSTIFKSISNDINDVMKIMYSSDFDGRSGLNEAGFKMLFISAAMNNMGKDMKFKSELPVLSESLPDYSKPKYKKMRNSELMMKKNFDSQSIKYNKFIDVLIETNNEYIIIELKYIRLNNISALRTDTRGLEKRMQLSKMGDNLTKMSDYELLESGTFTSIPINGIIKNAIDLQLLTYMELYEKVKTTNKPIYGYVFIGIGNRCLFYKHNVKSIN